MRGWGARDLSSSPHCHHTRGSPPILRPGSLPHQSTSATRPRVHPHHSAAAREQDRPRGPALYSCLWIVHTAHRHQPSAFWVRGSRSRPTGTRTGASAATVKRRASRRRSCSAAPPASVPVTRVQSGGLPSSVEPVDVIGSSFPLGATDLVRSRSRSQYLPRVLRCEPLLTWLFANALVIVPGATQSSSDRPTDTPVDSENRPCGPMRGRPGASGERR